MDVIINIIKVTLLSIIEGVTEFLPISSTGHLILANQWIGLEPQGFANAFNIIIQLGAILSVIVIYWKRLNPWYSEDPHFAQKPKRYAQWNKQTRMYYNVTHVNPRTMALWLRVIVAVIPSAVVGILFDDLIDEHLMTMPVVTFTLLFYGIVMIVVERWNAKRNTPQYADPLEFSLQTAFTIGLFQCLALVPGTSRSAATIIGAMVLGSSRVAAAEFSFFMAIPSMVGATLLKVLKNLGNFTIGQWLLIVLGCVLSFVVAYVVIQKFMAYVQKKDFKVFGYYRIGLSVLLLLYMLFGM